MLTLREYIKPIGGEVVLTIKNKNLDEIILALYNYEVPFESIEDYLDCEVKRVYTTVYASTLPRAENESEPKDYDLAVIVIIIDAVW